MGKAQRMKRRNTEEQQAQVKVQNKTPIILICVLLIVVTLAIYLQVTGFQFTRLDDDEYVSTNPFIKHGVTAQSMTWAFTKAYAGNWHPLTWVSHMLDVQLFGMNAGMHHLTGLLLHILNTLLLFFVLFRLTGFTWRSAFVAALFAVHPQHVESVAWVAERKDVLSTFFFLLTILTYTKYAQKPNVKRYLLVALSFGLGLMAKPMLVSLPIVLLILDFWPLKRTHKLGRLILEKLPLLAMAAVSCKLTIWAQKAGQAVTSTDVLPVGTRAANAAMSYVVYLTKTFWPAKLAGFYPHPADTWPQWQVAGSAVILICISGLAIWLIKRAPYVMAGWLWYLVTMVPVIGLMQVGFQGRADRYTYIPLIGIFTIIAWAVGELILKNPTDEKKPKLAGAVACVIILTLAGASYAQATYWRTSRDIYERAIAVTENNWFAHNGLGLLLIDKENYTQAEEEFRKTVETEPNFADGYLNLGVALEKQGKPAEAEEQFNESLSHNPNSSEAHSNLGVVCEELGKVDQAVSEYNTAIELNPNDIRARNNLGIIFAQQNKLKEAVEQWEAVLKIDPTLEETQYNIKKAREILDSMK